MISKRTSISKKTRFNVFNRDRFTCQYCGRKSPQVKLHLDHKHPISEGGNNDYENLITSCADCNLGKGSNFIEGEELLAEDLKNLLIPDNCFACGKASVFYAAYFASYFIEDLYIGICFTCLEKAKAETLEEIREQFAGTGIYRGSD